MVHFLTGSVQNTYFLNKLPSCYLECISAAQLMVLFLLKNIQFLCTEIHHCPFKVSHMHVFKAFWSYLPVTWSSISISLVFHKSLQQIHLQVTAVASTMEYSAKK